MEPNNPFLVAGYHSPKFFCDREFETQSLIDALHNGRNAVLISPRRIGKTGLICHTFYRVKEKYTDTAIFYMDIFSTRSLNDFVKIFADTVLGKLDSEPQKAINRIKKFLHSCRPVLTFDEMTGLPKVTVDIAADNETNTLNEIFDYLGSSEKRCCIAIDEFQQIEEYPEKGVEGLLRSRIQFLTNVSFIFAGSKKHIMQEMFTSSKRPFYQSAQLISIGPVNQREYFEFASEHFRKKGHTLSPETFNSVYEKFEGQTWYIQSVLNRMYGYGMNPDMNLVAYAIDQIIAESGSSYSDLMKAYSAGHVRLMKAIAKEGCVEEIMSGDFISRYGLRAASSVSSSLKKLTDNELVYRTENGYVIYDRFMGEWLRRLPF